MTIALAIDFMSLFFVLTVFTSFCIRKREKSEETRFFWKIITTNIFGIICEIIVLFTTSYYDLIPIQNAIFNKIYMALTIAIAADITTYTVFLNNNELLNKKRSKFYKMLLIASAYVFMFLVFVLPIHYTENFALGFVYGAYAEGPAVLWGVEFYCGVLMAINIIACIRYRRDYYWQRFICLMLYSITMVVINCFRHYMPGVTILYSAVSVITIFIYFIIQNYDVMKVTELNELKDKAEQVNDVKSKFLSNMSHQIRTNLNAIVGTSNLLIEEEENKNIKEDLRDIVYASDSLLEIVGNILDLNKIESDQFETTIEEYNLKKEAESLADMTSIRIENKPIKFVMDIDQTIPDYLKGDKVHIKQVINNFLTNAFKYTKEGTVIFTISSDTDLINKVCHLTISVKDSGIGIKDTSRLFTKFDRMDMDQTSTIEGTGLGLVITKKIVELMGGKIYVDSVYGKGSTFTVTLDQEISDGKETIENSIVNLDYDFGKRRILLVDDNKLNLRVAKKYFAKYNFELDATLSPREALKLIEKNGYDLIFTDIFMNETPASEILDLARKYEVPVVALTADAVGDSRVKYLKQGYSDYISKPFSQRDIYNVLVKHFRK